MHLELRQTDVGRWIMRMRLGADEAMVSPTYEAKLALDDDLARMAKALGEGGAARIPVVTVHEHGGERALHGDADRLHRADGALHAVKGATEFASLADWLPRGE